MRHDPSLSFKKMNGRDMKYLRNTWRAAVTQTTSLRAALCTYSVSWAPAPHCSLTLHYVLEENRLMRPPLVALLDLYPRLTAMPNMNMPRKSPSQA